MAPVVTLPAAKSVEVWGSIVDRHSIKDARDRHRCQRILFGVGASAYQRSEALFVRGSAQRELASGRGEWEAEVSYSQVIDSVLGMGLGCTTVTDCFGASNNVLLSAGGQLTYRLRADWMTIATLHVLHIANTRSDGAVEPHRNPRRHRFLPDRQALLAWSPVTRACNTLAPQRLAEVREKSFVVQRSEPCDRSPRTHEEGLS